MKFALTASHAFLRGVCVLCWQPGTIRGWILVVSIHDRLVKGLLVAGIDAAGQASSGDEIIEAGQVVMHRPGHLPSLDIERAMKVNEGEWDGAIVDPLGRQLDPFSLKPIVQTLPPFKPKQVATTESASSPPSSSPSAAPSVPYPLLSTPPPSLSARSNAYRFLPTGLFHLDAFHPLAAGLRVGVMGSKRTGKSELAAAVVNNLAKQIRINSEQHAALLAEPSNSSSSSSSSSSPAPSPSLDCPLPTPLRFIYVCVGQSRSDTRALIHSLRSSGALSQCTAVVANADDSLALQYLAPFYACTLADFWRNELDSHVLLVYDDLTAHGHVLNLINKVYGYPVLPPSYVHARLLERTAPLAETGASTTALVLAETGRADRSLEVSENLSGFVDHVIWLDTSLAAKGLFPAISASSVLGRPAARFRPALFRALTSRVSTFVLQSERVSNAHRWAKEFGLEQDPDEEDTRSISEFRDKMQLIMTHTPDPEPAARGQVEALTLTDQFLLLYTIQHRENMLANISPHNIFRFRKLIVQRLKETTMSMEEMEEMNKGEVQQQQQQAQSRSLYEALQHEVLDCMRSGMPMAAAALPLPTGDMPDSNPARSRSSESATDARRRAVWQRLDEMVDTFMEEFVDAYER